MVTFRRQFGNRDSLISFAKIRRLVWHFCVVANGRRVHRAYLDIWSVRRRPSTWFIHKVPTIEFAQETACQQRNASAIWCIPFVDVAAVSHWIRQNESSKHFSLFSFQPISNPVFVSFSIAASCYTEQNTEANTRRRRARNFFSQTKMNQHRVGVGAILLFSFRSTMLAEAALDIFGFSNIIMS